MNRQIIILLITYLFTSPNLLSASDLNNPFNLSIIADGNFVHIGKHVTIEDEGYDDIANIGFIVGEKCIAVIDTGGSVDIGRALLNSIRAVSDKPICYVVNTHIHYDHILGNLAFVDENPVFIGHHKLADAVEHNRKFFLDSFKKSLGDNPSAASIIGPKKLVNDKVELDLGDKMLTLISYPTSHSHNDLIVIDQTTNTLWAGDLIFRERIPVISGSLKGWIEVINELQKLDVEKVIPGHGPVADSVNDALAQQMKYLTRLLVETRKAIADGVFVNDAMETIDKDNSLNWLLHEYQHPTNVSRAFSELEWE